MAIPKSTLESAAQTLWSYRRALNDAVASKNKRRLSDAIEDLGILANHSRHPTVRDGARKTLDDLVASSVPPSARKARLAAPAVTRLGAASA